LSNLGFRLDGTQQNIEANGSSIQGRLLRYQRDLFAVFLDIQVGNKLIVKLEGAKLVRYGGSKA
jgi:hypothetical protein